MRQDRRRPDAPQGRDFALRFANAETVMRLVGAPRGVRTWHCPLPNHPDKRPSFSASDGREPGRTVIACSCGQRAELLDHFRKLGYRLGPMPPMRTAPPKVRRPVSVDTSVAFRALTPSERRMHDIIAIGANPTYEDFVAAGISRSAVSVGLRALQALGLIGVRRSPRRRGCKQYEQNGYWLESWWQQREPSGPSRKALNEALDKARTVARAARKGGEDISEPTSKAVFEPVEKTESGKWGWKDSFVQDQALGEKSRNSDLRVSEVRVRGSDSGTVTYVGEEYSSKVQDSSRPDRFGVEDRGCSGAGRETPVSMPNPNEGDPGPTSEDAYGYDPDPGPVWEPPVPSPPPPPEPVVSNAGLHHLADDNQAEGTDPVGDVVSFTKPEPKPPSASALNAAVRAAIARFEAEVGKAGTMERRVALYRELIAPLWTSGQLNPDEIYRLTLMMQGRWPPNRGAR